MKVPYVNLQKDHQLLKKELLNAIKKTLAKAEFILGEEVQKLERDFAGFCGMKYAVGVNSGTDAIFLALKSLGIAPGDEVITVPNSFLSTASSILACGAKPVFVDVREDMNIHPDLIVPKISKRTKVILPVHLAGKPADMKPILEIAKHYSLTVVEDAAQAVGALYHGKQAGSFGKVNCFSFHPVKTLAACGDGGMMVTDDEEIYKNLIALRHIGLKNRNEADLWGYNSRLDTLQAAILNVKFKYLNNWIKKRRQHAEYYRKHLSSVVQCPQEDKNERHAYHLFVIQTERRDALQNYLLLHGIDTRVHYPIPIHLQQCAKSLGYKPGDLPVAEKQARRILSLPIYQSLRRNQLDYVIEKILSFFR